ncbi:MAG: SpoIIE family protein phosphatase [Clostridiales bacterium]|nr:SpoIIE family protein phosphatase [Candidatus Cacconaster stercorequi]
MSSYVKLGSAALLPVIFSIILYLVDKKTAFGRLNKWVKQIVFGCVFGALAIIGTEFGVSVHGATMNVRDAAPVCAGLIFGAPAGVISGLIGGVERYLAAAWGAGEYTKIACSLSTIAAGLFAAWLRKYMFDDKKPSWLYGLATGAVAEVFHMLMVFLTNMDDARNCFVIVQQCAIPMITACSLATMLATLAISLLGKERLIFDRAKINITQTFQHSLLICVLIAFGLTSAFTYFVQDSVSNNQTENLLRVNISDVTSDISEASDAHLLDKARIAAAEVNSRGEVSSRELRAIAQTHNIVEINLIDENGIVVAATDPQNIGFDMHSGNQSSAFLILLNGVNKEFAQSYQPIARDNRVMRKYAGVALEKGGFVQVAYDAEDFQKDIAQQVVASVRNRHVGENGYLIVCDENFNIVSDRYDRTGWGLTTTGIHTEDTNAPRKSVFEATIYDESVYCMYDTTEGYYIISALPVAEAQLSRNMSVYITIFMEVMVFTALFILIYFLIKRLVVDNIRRVNASLSEITSGNLNVTVDVRSSEEFASLSDDINTTVSALKHYIDEAAARIDKELEFARTIQLSALPNNFPPEARHKEFDIWAGMTTAKEVGGDFYDFYMLGPSKLAFMIADVSGKGIPAAMFMMTAKTMIKNLSETGVDVDDVFIRANDQLCDGNDAGMFVTAWMGVLDLRTGLITFVNAGHNPPLIRKKDGSFEYLRSRASLVLAGMDGIRYRKNELQLEPGDTIYLYTDGVTEATNANEELYGEARLLKRLNSMEISDVEQICRAVKADVDQFVGEAPQFDDITMVCLTLNDLQDPNSLDKHH